GPGSSGRRQRRRAGLDGDNRLAASRSRPAWAVMDRPRGPGPPLLDGATSTGRCLTAHATARRRHGGGRRGAVDRSRPRAEVAERRAAQREEIGRHLAGAPAWFFGDP